MLPEKNWVWTPWGRYLLFYPARGRQKWLGVEQINGVLPLLLWTVLVVVVVFVLGILVDFVRKAICDGLHKIFLHIRPYRSLTEKIRDVDTMFKREVME